MADPDEHDFRFRDLVTYMAKGLVDHPDDVAVEIVSAGDDGILELSVHADDIGHVIGKQGRTAKSLRLALGAAASRVDRRMDLEIAD
ncbi:MAG: KH domain-containing protein [Candidatus Eisenbacteria bacterium]|uniref:RNA-binding protein KhpA n=1 Tax=Eiseniibacteriota bacterium TaxID=2212470 RepID=A0A933SDV4_UNCEI|nr:KH domain-containing protein [Candidatus Eisenbacteria bacterium]